MQHPAQTFADMGRAEAEETARLQSVNSFGRVAHLLLERQKGPKTGRPTLEAASSLELPRLLLTNIPGGYTTFEVHVELRPIFQSIDMLVARHWRRSGAQ